MRTLVTAVLLIGVVSDTARANEFDVVAASCVPDSTPILNPPNYTNLTNGEYVTSSGQLGWQGSGTGTLQFNCMIPVTITGPANLYILGVPDGGSINVEYVGVSKATGTFKDEGPIATATITGSGTSPISALTSFSDTYDITSYVYYVQVAISRSSATQSPSFFLASLY
jgi:hypothetical protein